MSLLYRIKAKRLKYLLLDLILVPLSIWLASLLTSFPMAYKTDLSISIFIVLTCLSYLTSFYFFQIYRIIWQYSNSQDFYHLLGANFSGSILSTIIAYFFYQSGIYAVMPLALFMTSASTVLYRLFIRDFPLISRRYRVEPFRGIHLPERNAGENRTILIAGAGEAGRIILKEFSKQGMGKYIIGFADDDPQKIGTLLNGKPVFSSVDSINEIILKYEVNEVIIAMPSVKRLTINRFISRIRSANPKIPVKILPSIMRPFEATLTPELRDIGISELIGREEVEIDINSIERHFAGNSLMITGAGGSIGSELCRQLLKFNIKRLIAVGRGEHSIYSLMSLLNEYTCYLEHTPEIEYRIADVTNFHRMESIFKEFRPDLVFHAAAHKHVHLMENNETEAFYNNVAGTRNILDLSLTFKAKGFILISTDKAVNPASVMGATKRVAELITLFYSIEKGLNSAIVRFGNVIGSRGSVIPLFQKQILDGGPVTITHPEMTRYFMSIPEATLLLLNAASYSIGGEIFVLDMGKQYKIDDIAKNLIQIYGQPSYKDIQIEYIGLRPGEKLYEELLQKDEKLLPTENEKIFKLSADSFGYSKDKINKLLNQTLPSIQKADPELIRSLLKELIPEYKPL